MERFWNINLLCIPCNYEITGELTLKQNETRKVVEEGERREEEGKKEGWRVAEGKRAGTLTTRLVRCKDGMLRPKKSLLKGRQK